MERLLNNLKQTSAVLLLAVLSCAIAQEVFNIKKTDNTILSIPTSEIETMYFSTGETVTGMGVTQESGVKDIDGNVYQTVTIGKQVWMKSDLKVTKFNDGSQIANVTDAKTWVDARSAAYSWYDNKAPVPGDPYGAMYNGYAASSGKICPKGWRVPTDNDWLELMKFCGQMGFDPPTKLKEKGTSHWEISSDKVTNETGFTALPTGLRTQNGIFQWRGETGKFWTSTEKESSVGSNLFHITFYKENSPLGSGPYSKNYGFCIRCIKDEF